VLDDRVTRFERAVSEPGDGARTRVWDRAAKVEHGDLVDRTPDRVDEPPDRIQ
jgi:hypothetical protein